MGWGRTLLLGDVGNRLDIGDVESDLEFLRQRLRENILEDQDQGGEIRRLRAEVEEMKLVVTTLVRLLAKKGIIEDEEIRAVAKGIE
jgi:hypothetical protein